MDTVSGRKKEKHKNTDAPFKRAFNTDMANMTATGEWRDDHESKASQPAHV